MKRIFFSVLLMVLVCANSLTVNAAHQHSSSCYEVQGAHKHVGNSANGGECYQTSVYHTHKGTTSGGGECFGTAVYHSHAGDTVNGGACYETAVYHSHVGDTINGGECYQTPVYHTHMGSSSKSGGCYTKANVCGGTIVQNKVDIVCVRTTGSKFGSTSWECECGGTVTQIGYNIVKNEACVMDHGVYYEISCNKCGKFSTQGSIGQHTGYKYTYSCSVCRTSYSSTGKCNSIKSYSVGCGKGSDFVEKYEQSCEKTLDYIDSYSLSCKKDAASIDKYSLSCKKTEKTVEAYALSCKKAESQGTTVLICKVTETEQKSEVKKEVKKEAKTEVKSKENNQVQESAVKSETKTADVGNGEEKEAKEVAENGESGEFVAENEEYDFSLECGLMADGVWVKLLKTGNAGEGNIENCFSWDGGFSWTNESNHIYDKN